MEKIKQIFRGSSMVGLLMLALGILFTYTMGRVSHLDCVRVQSGTSRCNLRITWMELVTVKETPIEELQGAYAQQDCDDDGCTYRVVLVTAAKDIPLTNAYSSGRAAKETIAQQVTTFVTDTTQPELAVKAGGGLALVIPVLFLGVGIYLFTKTLVKLYRGEPPE